MPKTRKCNRCNGTGTTRHTHVLGGICLACNGDGTVEVVDAATRAARLAAGRRRYAILTTLRERAEQIDGCRNGDAQHETMSACAMLEENEPTRYALMLTSVEAGRGEQVIAALRQYFHTFAA